MTLNIGDKIPGFTGTDQNGNLISSNELLGKPFVIYFYPKDNTPGCTKEACAFRDCLDEFEKLNTRIIGVSTDKESSHQKFIKNYSLNFTLIADTTKEICTSFNIYKDKSIFGKTFMGIVRTTFLVDKEGIIRFIERPVTVEGHVDRVLNALKQLTK